MIPQFDSQYKYWCNVLSLEMESNTIFWISEYNKYLIVESPLSNIIQMFASGKSIFEIAEWYTVVSGQSYNNCIAEVESAFIRLDCEIMDQVVADNEKQQQITNSSKSTKRYFNICNTSFLFDFDSRELESLIVPMIVHFEESEQSNIYHHFKCTKTGESNSLFVDDKWIGSWNNETINHLTGKISMEILQKIYKNNEEDWVAVFHASAVTDGEKGLVFFGNSGNGKSTLSAVMMSNGYKVLADDFLPLHASLNICHFPSALSIKNGSVKYLSTSFPELSDINESKTLSKKVRYLPNPISQTDPFLQIPVKALIYIKYDQETDFLFHSMDKKSAFQRLVIDSWISPHRENVGKFLNWFSELPCYQLSYSDNQKMVSYLEKYFEDGQK